MSRMVKHLISVSCLIIPVSAFAAPGDPTPIVFQSGIGNQASNQAGSIAVPATLVDPSEGNIPSALQRWRMLSQSANYDFSEYASFLMAYPDWPQAEELRKNAEQAINLLRYSPNQAVAYFDRLPPLTNSGRAKYALSLAAVGDRQKAEDWAKRAWREGPLTDDDETRIQALIGGKLTSADNDARIAKLLWSGGVRAAQRILPYASDQRRPTFEAWIAAKTGAADSADRFANLADKGDPGLLADRANQLRAAGNSYTARELLANRPRLSYPAASPKDWFQTLLKFASAAADDGQYDLAYKIAANANDALPSGYNMADQDLTVRDPYTSLVWLGGQMALNKLGRPADAVALFRLYGNAAKTPQTRTKGFYWAGKAAALSGDRILAAQQYEEAGKYYDYFYGQLALEALGRPLPVVPAAASLPSVNTGIGGPSTYIAARITPRYGGWKDQSEFLRAISKTAKTQNDYLSAISLSKQLGRPDLSVMAGRNARVNGFTDMIRYAFPTVDVPGEHIDNWTMIHAIARQESQFDRAIVSHAGARGLMQLMPGTARETAGKAAMSYRPEALTNDPAYNIQLGSSYFKRILAGFNGSYPLAVAAYNAGPGNVNKWLRLNGDPRTGSISMVDWIEAIPIYETRNYVQRVLENAVVYGLINPDKSDIHSATPLSTYLGKSIPG